MKTNINFIKLKNFAFILSAVVILLGIWSMFGPKNVNLGPLTPKGFNLGIDFQGGGVHQVMIYNGATQETVRMIANENQMGNEIQNVINSEEPPVASSKNFIVKTAIDENDKKFMAEKNMTSSQFFNEKITKFHKSLSEKFGAEYELKGEELAKAIEYYGDDKIPGEIVEKRTDDSRTVYNVVKLSQNIISANQSTTLRWQSVFLALFVIAIMLLYLSLRFRIEYGLGAVLSLIHDVLIMLGFVSIAHLEFDMTLVAGLLTFMGYTVNDTIVIYDRIRENHTILKDEKIERIFNISINQCITRSLLTSFTTLLAVLSLFFFAGEKLRGFSSIMIAGILIGTYSSLFIASPLVYLYKKWFGKEDKEEKKAQAKLESKQATAETQDQENSEKKSSNTSSTLVLSKKQQKKLESMKNGD